MRFSTDIAIAKTGLRIPRSLAITLVRAGIPAPGLTDSILWELYFKLESTRVATQILWSESVNNAMRVDFLANNQIRCSTNALAQSRNITIPFAGLHGIGFLIDRTNARFVIYNHGQIVDSAVLTSDPVFPAGWQYFMAGPGNTFTFILNRFTTFTSTPASMPDIMKRHYAYPMVLHQDLQALAVLGMQWDLTTDAYGVGALTTLNDTGVVGGYPLSSGATDLKTLLVEVEKP